MGQVLIVGGGPAGMMAAIAAAGNGQQVALYEQNDKLGKKLFITGKGRCNITNDGDRETFFSNVISNPRFLYGAYARLDSTALQNLFRAWGLPLKTERGARVFPLSDKSSDVIRTLEQELRRLGVRIFLNAKVRELALENGVCKGIYLENGTLVEGEKIIVATGGLSYPVTGSTGDGYTFAIQAGHHITSLRPALTAMETRETMTDVMGISLKNVSVSVWQKKKCLYEGFGEMLFTHFGVSGPLILSASSLAGRVLEKEPLLLQIDFKPALSREQLDARLLRIFGEEPNKDLRNVLGGLLPAKLLAKVLEQSGVDLVKKVHDTTKVDREKLVESLKGFSLHLTGLRPYKEAIITQGGVQVKEIDPSTMGSKKVQGLYFAGEVLDLDALTGGFNLQIAWSTGYVAGNAL